MRPPFWTLHEREINVCLTFSTSVCLFPTNNEGMEEDEGKMAKVVLWPSCLLWEAPIPVLTGKPQPFAT